jgi:hypothetical protein
MLEVEYLADIKVGVYEAPTIPKSRKVPNLYFEGSYYWMWFSS